MNAETLERLDKVAREYLAAFGPIKVRGQLLQSCAELTVLLLGRVAVKPTNEDAQFLSAAFAKLIVLSYSAGLLHSFFNEALNIALNDHSVRAYVEGANATAPYKRPPPPPTKKDRK